jgi:hypothetical protein
MTRHGEGIDCRASGPAPGLFLDRLDRGAEAAGAVSHRAIQAAPEAASQLHDSRGVAVSEDPARTQAPDPTGRRGM